MAQVIKDVVTWLKQWFYTEDEIDTITGGLQTQINNKADSTTVSSLSNSFNTHTHGNLQNDGKVGTSNNASKNVVTDANGKITTEAKYSHPSTHATSIITEASALSNLNTSANATQHTINTQIDSIIGTLKSVEFIKVVSDKGTASADTMNKLYIEVGASQTDMYYTSRSGTSPNYTYTWNKLDSDILDDLSINWNDVQNKPAFGTGANDIAYGNHGHGQITTDGKVTTTTSTVGNVVVTDSSGVVKVINKLPAANVTHQSLTGKSDKTATLGTTVTLVNKGETNEGCMIFNTIS